MKFMQIKPQKARGKLQESYWTDPEWVAEEKFDGDRRIGQCCDGLWRFTGTRESVDGTGLVEKTQNLAHLSECMKLNGTVLDGEIIAPFAKNLPGGKSKYVTSIMGSSPEEALRKQREHGWLEYMVFDCLWYKGDDIRQHNLVARRIMAQKALRGWGSPYAKLVPQFLSPNFKTKKDRFEQILKEGGEGVILKHTSHTYGDESLWVKVKGEWTADVVVMGFEAGEGKYAGKVGAIVFGQYAPGRVTGTAARGGVYLTKLGTCRGFTDALMDDMTKHPKKYLNRVMEIKHYGREPTGAFRHPQFKRFRDDKSAKDCVYRENET